MTQDNATQTGADSLQPAHSGRNAALAQIAAAVDASYQEDLSQFDETSGKILAKPEQAQEVQQETQAAAEDGEQQEQQEQHEAATQTQTTDDTETIVVDGQQVQVKRTQLLDAGRRTLQKESAAEKRLQEATEMLRQAQAYSQSLRQNAQPSQDAGQFSQSPSSDATNGNGLIRQQATPDIGTLVDERLWIHEATKAAQRFKTEFKEIADDPLLMRLAGQLEDERLAEAARQGLPPGDPWEAYRTHGETIKSRFLKTAATQAQVTGTEDRLEKKRSTTTVVGAGARAQSSQPQKPPTTAEQIERMRIARMGKAIPMNRT